MREYKKNQLIIYTLFYKQQFYTQCQAETGKKLSNAKQHPEAELSLFKNYSLSSSTLSSKNNTRYSEKCSRNKCVCFNDVIWLMSIKIRLKVKSRSQRYDINKPRPTNGHKYTKHKMCLSIMIVICIKQQVSSV